MHLWDPGCSQQSPIQEGPISANLPFTNEARIGSPNSYPLPMRFGLRSLQFGPWISGDLPLNHMRFVNMLDKLHFTEAGQTETAWNSQSFGALRDSVYRSWFPKHVASPYPSCPSVSITCSLAWKMGCLAHLFLFHWYMFSPAAPRMRRSWKHKQGISCICTVDICVCLWNPGICHPCQLTLH